MSPTRVVASFGEAELVQITTGGYEFCGSSEDDLTAAKEWISLFLHEAVMDVPPL